MPDPGVGITLKHEDMGHGQARVTAYALGDWAEMVVPRNRCFCKAYVVYVEGDPFIDIYDRNGRLILHSIVFSPEVAKAAG